ncbi:MAG: NADPH-dependent reductase [Verrucomicrobiales bacterium]|nr:NADPH-dependent reductase [Verrucomicrobiales bacterium]
MTTTRILGLSGSLRAASFNTGLLRAAARLMPDGAELTVRTIDGIPLYDGDVEVKEGIPAAVTELGKEIAAADGLLLASPEYNNSVPGPLKNAVDWLSRLDEIHGRPLFAGKPVAVIGATPGGFGTVLGQSAWLPVLRTLETRPWFGGRLMVARVSGLTDDTGLLTDEDTKVKLKDFLAGFAAFARS